MKLVDQFFTVSLILIVAFVLFKKGNRTQEIIGTLGKGSTNWISTLSGQYQNSGY